MRPIRARFNEQIEEVVGLVEEKFPKVAPGNHVNLGACIRFIYGQFEKQGILRSEKDFERMKKEKLDCDNEESLKKHPISTVDQTCNMKMHEQTVEKIFTDENYKVVWIDSKETIKQQGAVHCITMQVPMEP